MERKKRHSSFETTIIILSQYQSGVSNTAASLRNNSERETESRGGREQERERERDVANRGVESSSSESLPSITIVREA